MNNLKGLLFAAAIFATVQVSAQTDQETTAKLVESKNLVFNATQAYPLNGNDIAAVLGKMPGAQLGNVIQLSGSRYQLVIEKEKVEAFLPYFGRAYSANRDINDSGIKLKTENFSYVSEKKKKGNYVVTIKPQNDREVQSMTLNITQAGYASLTVTSNNRQPITFNGYISEPAPEKELSR